MFLLFLFSFAFYLLSVSTVVFSLYLTRDFADAWRGSFHHSLYLTTDVGFSCQVSVFLRNYCGQVAYDFVLLTFGRSLFFRTSPASMSDISSFYQFPACSFVRVTPKVCSNAILWFSLFFFRYIFFFSLGFVSFFSIVAIFWFSLLFFLYFLFSFSFLSFFYYHFLIFFIFFRYFLFSFSFFFIAIFWFPSFSFCFFFIFVGFCFFFLLLFSCLFFVVYLYSIFLFLIFLYFSLLFFHSFQFSFFSHFYWFLVVASLVMLFTLFLL